MIEPKQRTMRVRGPRRQAWRISLMLAIGIAVIATAAKLLLSL